ncbi:MAG TPA: ABC transporter permease [Pyrinomonadaceae bacterium]|nr:ABC transporter permease [Pyrinomonadaceae bacterium]
MDSLIKDIRYGIRSLLKRPGFTAIALVALALGIGANTAIFSLVNAVVLRPLPFPQPDQLVWAWGFVRNGSSRASVSPLDFLDYRTHNKTFEQLAATGSIPLSANMTGNGDPERLNTSLVTGNYFDMFKIAPALGRGFTLDNEKTGQDQVTILSYDLWQRRFGGDPGVLGKTVVLNGKATEIIGVMGKDVSFPQAAELWMPMNFDSPDMKLRQAHFLRPVGRLKPGVSIRQAQADLDVIAAQLEEQYPASNTGWGMRLVSLREQLLGGSRTFVFILFGAVGLVLLIACANVANLLLVRAAARQKEIALRTALGASRLRIIRQMITESVLLAIVGGALGVLLARAGVDLLVSLSQGTIPPTVSVRVDSTVLLFTFLLSLATGVLFGLAPAFRTLQVNLIESLKEGVRGGGENTLKNRTRSVLVVVESAIAVMLLIGAGLLVRSLVALQGVNPGFDSNNVMTARLDIARKKYDTAEKRANFLNDIQTRVGNLPGVETVGVVTELPLSGQPNDMPFTVEGRPPASPDQAFGADWRRVNENYFNALRIPLLRGRNFTPQEVRKSDPVVIVSQSLVDQVFPNEDPLGKRLILAIGDKRFEVVGVTGDIRHRALSVPPVPTMYIPTFETGSINLVIRTNTDPASIAGSLRKEVLAVDSEQPIAAVRPMTSWVEQSVAGQRYNMMLLGLFALLAVVLAATGIYGVMSYTVAQRTHEIGVRMALGARRLDVLKLVVRQGMILAVIGVVAGLLGAFVVTRVMSSFLFEVQARDPITFVAVALLLMLVAFMACLVPALRATKVNPLIALRYE